jgi:Lon protease-like protein
MGNGSAPGEGRSVHLGIMNAMRGCLVGTTTEVRAKQCRYIEGTADTEMVITARGCHRFAIIGSMRMQRGILFAKAKILCDVMPHYRLGPYNPFPSKVTIET